MRTTNKIKKYHLPVQEHYFLPFLIDAGIEYHGERITIVKGVVIVWPDNCSDGCSPTYKIPLTNIIVGPWNGRVYEHLVPNYSDDSMSIRYLMPETYRAFFLHDVLLETRHLTGITTEQAHQAFCEEIMKTKFIFKRQYCWLVNNFGPRD